MKWIQKIIIAVSAVMLMFSAVSAAEPGTKSDWTKPYVQAAYETQVLKGYDDGSFGGENYVTWEEAIALITRAVALNTRESERPVITSLVQDEVIPSANEVTIKVQNAADFTLYAYRVAEYGRADGICQSTDDYEAGYTRRSFIRKRTPLHICGK